MAHRNTFLIGLVVALVMLPMAALADSIDPGAFSATLDVGESVTITKTVTITEVPSSALLDVMFLFDTSGSMGDEITQAKTAAGDILSGLAAFGDLASGVGYYDEPGPGTGYPPAIIQDLSTSAATTASSINTGVILGMGGGGGDFPEEGVRSVTELAEGVSWREGSTRIIIALGDATWKESDGFTTAGALAALDAENITLIGIDYGGMLSTYDGIPVDTFTAPTGGSVISSSGLDPDDLVADIIAGVTGVFAEYDTVALDLSEAPAGVSVAAVPADYFGDFDRSVERTFDFDVTFTGDAPGDYSFSIYATVDGGRVASEADRITVGDGAAVPEPNTMLLLGAGLLGLSGFRRRFKE
jgi:hypothetical protein